MTGRVREASRPVVRAAETRRLHTVGTIDEGIEILTGVKAGERDSSMRFPAGTINRLVEDKLKSLAERARSFARSTGNGPIAKDNS